MIQTLRFSCGTAIIVSLFLAWFVPAQTLNAATIIPPPPAIAANSYMLVDANTNKVIAQLDPDKEIAPASLTKIMTSYIVENEIQAGRVKGEDEVLISVKAWRTGGSKMFIREGTRVSVDDLIRGVIIQSGNDASVALAEHIAGSESAFADMMNQQAAALGMASTQFKNATGLPNDEHYTTTADLVKLARALVQNYPEQYKIYSEKNFEYGDIRQPNRNRLLWRDRSVDGIKTGYTEDAGYCLIASAERDGMRLISVVMGTASDEARMRESQKLISYGFRYFETNRLYESGIRLFEQEIYYGEADSLSIGVLEDVVLTYPRGSYDDLKTEMVLPDRLSAPFAKGAEIGRLEVALADEVIYSTPLYALEAVEEGGFLGRIGDFVYLLYADIFEG